MGIITSVIAGMITAILAVLVFIIAVVGNAISKLLADDVKAWLPKIIEHLVRRAVRKLPDGYQEIYYDEWRAHLDDMPGDLVRLVIALRFQHAAWQMRAEALSAPPISARLVVIPLLVPVLWNLYTTFRGLADFFDLPTYPSSAGQFAFGLVSTIIVIGFVIASRMIWRFASEDTPMLLLKAASVTCIGIDVGASWIGTKQVIYFEDESFGVAFVMALVVLSTISLSMLLFDKHGGNKSSSS